jgi:hypothetical protein
MNANNVNPASIAAQALAKVASKHGTPARPPIANGKFRPVADTWLSRKRSFRSLRHHAGCV